MGFFTDELTDSITAVSGGGVPERLQDPVRIIHKDQDVISTFCINAVMFLLFNTSFYVYIHLISTFMYCIGEMMVVDILYFIFRLTVES